MKTILCTLVSLFILQSAYSQPLPPSQVNFAQFLKLAKEVQIYRADRVVHYRKWLAMSKMDNTIILDTRSKAMYNAKHIKGAIHLNFSDFTTPTLNKLIPNKNTRILIYCNNNIENDNKFFYSKMYVPTTPKETKRTLALNIPTFINLYGYGYKNVYELANLIDATSNLIEFEGTATRKSTLYKKK